MGFDGLVCLKRGLTELGRKQHLDQCKNPKTENGHIQVTYKSEILQFKSEEKIIYQENNIL